MSNPYPTVVLGLGRIGVGYADDPKTARYYPYATHAQVLRDHPAFAWVAAVDRDRDRGQIAHDHWQVSDVATQAVDLPNRDQIAVAVLATPPDQRFGLLELFPALRAVIVEKPLGTTLAAATAFVEACRDRQIAIQVNLWRRADQTFQSLATGQLAQSIGSVQAVHVTYGNGFLNNGPHLVDILRMLIGEVQWGQATQLPVPRQALPILEDANLVGCLGLSQDVVATWHALDFQHYREIGLELWGDRGKLSILNEGLTLQVIPRSANRALSDAFELDYRQSAPLPSTVGMAFYRLYDNVADHLQTGAPLWSSGASAIATARGVDLLWRSAQQGGRRLDLASQTIE